MEQELQPEGEEEATSAGPDDQACPREGDVPQRAASSVIVFLSGLGTFAFLAWLGWLITGIVFTGIPETDRAELVSELVLSAAGVLISAVITAQATSTNPLGFLADTLGKLRALLKR